MELRITPCESCRGRLNFDGTVDEPEQEVDTEEAEKDRKGEEDDAVQFGSGAHDSQCFAFGHHVVGGGGSLNRCVPGVADGAETLENSERTGMATPMLTTSQFGGKGFTVELERHLKSLETRMLRPKLAHKDQFKLLAEYNRLSCIALEEEGHPFDECDKSKLIA